MPFELQLSDFAWDTPGLIEPAGNGIQVATVPAGSFAELSIVTLVDWDQYAELIGSIAADNIATPAPVGWWVIGTTAPTADAFPSPQYFNNSNVWVAEQALHPIAQAITACGIFLRLYTPGADPTAGSSRAVTKIYS